MNEMLPQNIIKIATFQALIKDKYSSLSVKVKAIISKNKTLTINNLIIIQILQVVELFFSDITINF